MLFEVPYGELFDDHLKICQFRSWCMLWKKMS